MRAQAKVLCVFLLAAYPSWGLAQNTDPLGLDAIPAPPSVQAGGSRVKAAQFEDLFEPEVPSAAEEADTVPAVAEEAPVATPAAETAGPAELPTVSTEETTSLLGTEVPTTDFGDGTHYDLPITDMVHSSGGEVYSTNNWFRGGHWYSKQEFLMLLRTDISPVHVAVDATEALPPGEFLPSPFVNSSINSKDAGFTYEAGTRLILGHVLGRDVANRDHSIEIGFTGLFDYTGRTTLIANDPTTGGVESLLGSQEVTAIVDGILGGFPAINRVLGFDNSISQELEYEANFNSLELNYMVGARPMRDRLVLQPDGRWVRHATPSIVRGIYSGLRYIRQNDTMTHTGLGGRNRFQDATGNITFLERVDGGGGLYRVATDNDLLGLQFGGEVIRKRTDWVIGANGKLGGLINFSDRQSTLVQTFDDDLTNAVNLTTETSEQSLNDETMTLLLEANVFVSYYIRPNTSLRFGYNAIYLNGVANAADNLGLQGGFAKFETTGDALYHGANVGFEMTW